MDSSNPFADKTFAIRMLFMLFAGLVVAGCLTWFMYVLIQFGERKVEDSKRVHWLDIVRVKREETSAKKERRVERPKTSEAPPAPASPDLSDAQNNMDAIAISDLPAQMDVGLDLGGIGSGIAEGEFLPIVKVAPVYPASAASRGIEGECLVEYSVSTTGATKNIRVIEDQCIYRGFRKPSIAAAARFKYKPRIINGEPVEVERVRNLFIFQLENPGGESNER